MGSQTTKHFYHPVCKEKKQVFIMDRGRVFSGTGTKIPISQFIESRHLAMVAQGIKEGKEKDVMMALKQEYLEITKIMCDSENREH